MPDLRRKDDLASAGARSRLGHEYVVDGVALAVPQEHRPVVRGVIDGAELRYVNDSPVPGGTAIGGRARGPNYFQEPIPFEIAYGGGGFLVKGGGKILEFLKTPQAGEAAPFGVDGDQPI